MQAKFLFGSAAVALGAYLWLATAAVAQQSPAPTRPDAGALMQQLEPVPPSRLPQADKPLPTPLPELQPRGDLQVTVSSFQFVGNSRLQAPALQAAVAPWLNRPLDFNELRKAAAAVASAYRAAGWIVRAYLPEQQLQGGVVTIHIVEAVFGEVQFDGADRVPVSSLRIRQHVLAVQAHDATLSAAAIDRALLLINDLPGVAVTGNLKAGSGQGQTDLVLTLSPAPRLSGALFADNAGARSTGANRVSGSLVANSAFGIGDRAGADLIHTDGSDYLRGAWSLPLGNQGLRGGLSYSRLQYRVVSREFAALDLNGNSSNAGLDFNYPLQRARTHNLYLSLALEHKTYDNRSAATPISHYKNDLLSVGVAGNRYDALGGGGFNAGSLLLGVGKLNLDGSANAVADAAGPRTAGSYTKLRYAFSRNQSLGASASVQAAVSGQQSTRNLDTGERFYLGGNGGVRAYPSSEAGGADGVLFDLEGRYRLPYNLTASVFYDWGSVKLNHDNQFTGAARRNSLSLQGAGVGLGWVATHGLNLRVLWSRRIGSNPNPTANGSDQDGSYDLNRLWFSAFFPF